MAQQEEGRQLAELIELLGPLDKRIEEILRVKDKAPSLISSLPQRVYKNLN